MPRIDGDFVIVEHERVTKVIDVGQNHLSVRALLSGGDIRWIELNWVDNVGNFIANRIQKRVYLPNELDELELMAKSVLALIQEIKEYQTGIDLGRGDDNDR